MVWRRESGVACGAEKCACTYLSCTRRGDCCACVAHHRDRGEIPGCFFTTEGERSYDRSLDNFFRDQRS